MHFCFCDCFLLFAVFLEDASRWLVLLILLKSSKHFISTFFFSWKPRRKNTTSITFRLRKANEDKSLNVDSEDKQTTDAIQIDLAEEKETTLLRLKKHSWNSILSQCIMYKEKNFRLIPVIFTTGLYLVGWKSKENGFHILFNLIKYFVQHAWPVVEKTTGNPHLVVVMKWYTNIYDEVLK